MSWPTFPGVVEAPITATDFGAKMASNGLIDESFSILLPFM